LGIRREKNRVLRGSLSDTSPEGRKKNDATRAQHEMTYSQSWQEIMDELQSEGHRLRTARAAIPVLTVHCVTLLNSQPEITASLSAQKCSDNAAESNKFLRNLTLAHGNIEGTKSLQQFCPG
jgi:hypothetical protein